jgi:hypothetical protein
MAETETFMRAVRTETTPRRHSPESKMLFHEMCGSGSSRGKICASAELSKLDVK